MAILSKIRKLPIILVVLIIGIPLLTFVADPTSLSKLFGSGNGIGEVNGEEITRAEFSNELKRYQTQSAQVSKYAFDNLVRNKIYEKQLSEAGITIGEADIFEVLCEQAKNNPTFQTQGVFDRNKLKIYLSKLKQNPKKWSEFKQNSLNPIKESLLKSTYNNLVSAGLGSSLKEGELNYNSQNTKLSGETVLVNYNSIPDSTVNVSNEEVKTYLENHKSAYQVEASRDLNFVKFDIAPKQRDEDSLKRRLSSFLEDRLEYSPVAKTEITVKGFKNTTDYYGFFIDRKSDLPYIDKVYFESTLPSIIAQQVLTAGEGDVVGPYKEKGYYKMAKVHLLSIPDSVKAKHILIPFTKTEKGTATKKEAKQFADSLLTVLKADKSKFGELVEQFSVDKGSAKKGGDLGWFDYSRMVAPFRDYCFNNKTGDLGLVESQFGFHIINIQDQKERKKAYKLAIFGQKMEAFKQTQDEVFDEVQAFEEELSKGKSLEELSKEKSLNLAPANGIGAFDEEVPSLGKNREIVTWAFDTNRKVGDTERFNTDNGYVIVTLSDKIARGLMPVKKALPKVKPILIKEKKQKAIIEKMKGATLKEIADANKTIVRTFSDVTLKSPTISGIGYEPSVVGSLLYAKENTVIKPVLGNKGVFAVKLTSRTAPIKLENYDTERKRIVKSRKRLSSQLYNELKKSANVVNNLAGN